MKFACVKRYDDISSALSEKLTIRLSGSGYIYDDEDPDYVFVVGGEGTFLKAVHRYMDKLDSIAFFGIHTGTLGFFSDYTDKEFEEFVSNFLNAKPRVCEYQLLKVSVDDKVHYALNEMRVENVSRTQKIDVEVDGEDFERFSGTGLCVCTQLGSTAFNRSLNGAVIQEGLPLIEMSEISGIHNRYYRSLGSSIVMKEDAKIVFKSDDFSSAILCIDYLTYDLDDAKMIKIELSTKRVKILRYKDVGYFKRLKSLF